MASTHTSGVTLNIVLIFNQEFKIMRKGWEYRRVEPNGDAVINYKLD